MTTPLDAVRQCLDTAIQRAVQDPLLSWMVSWLGLSTEEPVWAPPKGILHYRDVAIAGLALQICENQEPRNCFLDGIESLSQRRYFRPGHATTLEGDPLCILGLAVGIAGLATAESKHYSAWLQADIIGPAVTLEQSVHREHILRLASAMLASTEPLGALSSVLKLAFGKRLSIEVNRAERALAFADILSLEVADTDWKIFQAAALKEIFSFEATVDLNAPSIDNVTKLLAGAQAGLKRWPWEIKPKTSSKLASAQRWDIQNEYHVQSLLWVILRPVFPRLEDEEYLPSVGHKHPRADILIPELQLVIEAKFLRESNHSARSKLIEEIAADKTLYLSEKARYRWLLPVVWDATCSLHHHDEISQGLTDRGILAPIFIVRPGEWAINESGSPPI